MKKILLTMIIISLFTLFVGNVQAGTETGTLEIYANVEESCLLTSNTLDFGTYNGELAQQTTSVDVQCTDGTVYTVSYDEGSNFFGSDRRLSDSGGNFLNYEIYCFDEMVTPTGICGDDVHGTTVTVTGDGLVQSLRVDGEVPAGQFIAPGSYADIVGITVTY